MQYLTIIIFLSSLGVLVTGFVNTSVISEGLLKAWRAGGPERMLWFIGVLTVLIVLADRLSFQIKGLVVGTICWLMIIYGLGPVAAVAFFFVSAVAIGDFFTKEFLEPDWNFLDRSLVSFVVGTAAIMALIQVLAHFPVNNRITYLLILGAPLIFNFASIKDLWAGLNRFFEGPRPAPRDYYSGAVLFLVLALHSVYAAFPEVGHDALVNHLMIPCQMEQLGKWEYDPSQNLFAVIPYGSTWIYSVMYILSGEAAVKLLNFVTVGATILLLISELRKHIPASLAFLVAGFLLATPVSFTLSQWLFPETLLTAFVLGGFLISVRSGSVINVMGILAFSLCVGAALAVKLYGLIICGALVTLVLLRFYKELPIRSWFLYTSAMAGVILVVGAKPYLYGYLATGNPVFPFFNKIFASPFYPSVNFVDGRWIGHASWDLLYKLTFDSHVFGELYNGAFGFQHLLLLPAGILVTLIRGSLVSRSAVFVSAVYLSAVLFNTQYIRYLYPIFPLLTLVETEALKDILHLPKLRWISFLTAVGLTTGNLIFLATGCHMLGGFQIKAVLNSEAREDYVKAHNPVRHVNDVINVLAGRNTKVMYVAAPFGAGLHGRPVYTNWYNPILNKQLARMSEPEQFRELMRTERITHVVISRDQVDQNKAFLDFLHEEGTVIFTMGDVKLYELGTRAK